VLIRLSLVTLTGIIVLIVPRFADLMALIGATCCTLLAFILPALCHLALFRRDLNMSQYIMDIFLVFLGILGAILGTIDAVKTVMQQS
jgi:proton-coupled amino acid transporter